MSSLSLKWSTAHLNALPLLWNTGRYPSQCVAFLTLTRTVCEFYPNAEHGTEPSLKQLMPNGVDRPRDRALMHLGCMHSVLPWTDTCVRRCSSTHLVCLLHDGSRGEVGSCFEAYRAWQSPLWLSLIVDSLASFDVWGVPRGSVRDGCEIH